MKERHPENQIEKIPVPWRLYLEIGFIALLVVGVMWYLLQQTKSISAIHDSLLMNVSGIELKVTTSHLWFEEILSGDSTQRIEAVRELLDQAERHLQALTGKVLDSGEHVRPDVAVDTHEDIGLLHRYHESHVISYIKESTELVAEKLIQFREIFEKRYNAVPTSGPGTEIDQRFDQVFIELLKRISEITNKIQDLKAHHLAEYRIIQTSLIFICLGLAVLSAVILHLFERRRAKDLLTVMRSEDALLLYQKRLKSVKEIGSLASSTLSLEFVLQSILSGTLEAANASVGMIFLKDPDTGCLSWGASMGLSEAFVKEYKHQHIQPGEGLSGRIAQTGEPIYIPKDSSHDPRIARPVVEDEGLNSFIGVPIYAAGEIIGVMNILTRPPDILSEDDITLAAAIGAHVGSAIRNAHLFGQRKKAGEALRESEKKYRLLVKNLPGIVYQGYKDWSIEFIDKKVELLTGYDVDEFNFKKMKWSDIIIKDDIETARESFIQALKIDKSYVREYQIKSKSGDIHWIQERGQITCSEKGEILCVNGVFFDITERKQAEKEKAKLENQLQQAQKMEAIGTLAGGIAHDFNNILFPIFGYAEMALDDTPEGSSLYNSINEILQGAKRAGDLVKQILTFSRQADQELKPLKVQLIIKEVLKLIRATLPTTIEIKQYVSNKCGLVVADPTQIHQIAMNLMTNAFHAMEDEGGKLEVTLKEVELEVADLRDPEMVPGSYVYLTVSDTGIGMEHSVLYRIFDPYFSTKEKDKGTGLGLSVVHGIVKSYKGDIRVYSKLGEGTAFHVYLPVIKTQAETEEADAVAPVPKGTERILLVDDEEPIVRMEKQMLERLGYHVTERTSSVEALEAFRASPGKFDLVITDMTMPNMTGIQLSQKLLDIRPGIPIIICTGFSTKIDNEKAKAFSIRGYVMKPVVMSELANKIREVLDDELKIED